MSMVYDHMGGLEGKSLVTHMSQKSLRKWNWVFGRVISCNSEYKFQLEVGGLSAYGSQTKTDYVFVKLF